MNVILIVGQKNAGKSTVAKMIRELVPGSVEVALAAKMKQFLGEVFDWDEETLNGPSENREKPDPRYIRGYDCPACWQMGDDPDLCHCCGKVGPLPPVYLTPRFAAQTLGTEWGRMCFKGVWVNYALRAARELMTEPRFIHPPLIVIPDCRFVNEAKGVHDVGGHVWRLSKCSCGKRNGRKTCPECGPKDTHTSEQEQFTPEMDKYVEWDLWNDETLEALRENVRLRLRCGGIPF